MTDKCHTENQSRQFNVVNKTLIDFITDKYINDIENDEWELYNLGMMNLNPTVFAVMHTYILSQIAKSMIVSNIHI